MTAEELTLEILDRRNVGMREKDYWTCFEVNEREETGRCPLALVQGPCLGCSPSLSSPTPEYGDSGGEEGFEGQMLLSLCDLSSGNNCAGGA